MHRRTILKHLALAAAAPAALSLTRLAAAREAPLRVIVPFPPGGGTDVLGRVIAATLEGALDRSVVVENKPGASGMLGADYTANGAKDGSVLLFAGLVPWRPSARLRARPICWPCTATCPPRH
ncbi:hypothetical protein G6F68_010131 [Rhizopus microsporus]|nr:hypothetical protein G6F68_010131 [Rhizopus microsporus]